MITLDTARKIMHAINIYHGPMVSNALTSFVELETGETPATIAAVIEFLQEVAPFPAPSPSPSPSPPVIKLDSAPLNLMDELEYNYKVAKMVLQTSLAGDQTIDPEETRKSLKTISNFMEQALKLQERLYNTQQMQKFQEAVLDVIATVDPVYRDSILERLLNE